MILADIDLRLLPMFRAVVEGDGQAPAETMQRIGRSGWFRADSYGPLHLCRSVEAVHHCDDFRQQYYWARLRGRLTIALFAGCLSDPNCQLYQPNPDERKISDAVPFEVIVTPEIHPSIH